MKDMVTITCYGETATMERSKAIDFYEECIAGSDGSERNRYINIVISLKQGLTEVSDGE